jgi:hypothetical protein
MKKASLIATIGCALVILWRVVNFITIIQWVTSEWYNEYNHSGPFHSAFYQITASMLGIIAWCLIGYFFLTLYKKQPK